MILTTKKLADDLVLRLKEYGFIVQRYDCPTKSIYLKLDCGVCNSIRISNHRGKKYLRYRYNLLTTAEQVYSFSDRGIIRYFYPPIAVDKLIEDVLYARKKLIDTYGRGSYQQFIANNKRENETKKGFWQKAKFV